MLDKNDFRYLPINPKEICAGNKSGASTRGLGRPFGEKRQKKYTY